MQDQPTPEQVQQKIEREAAEAEAERNRVEEENELATQRQKRLQKAMEEDRWKGGDLPDRRDNATSTE